MQLSDTKFVNSTVYKSVDIAEMADRTAYDVAYGIAAAPNCRLNAVAASL